MLGFAALAEVALAEIPGTTNNVTPSKKVVGWGYRHKREDLEERLAKQRGNTFSRRWFDELLEAEHALVVKAEKSKGKQRRALEQAADSAAQVIERVEDQPLAPPDLTPLLQVFHEATIATHARGAIAKAHVAIVAARVMEERARFEDQLEDDDEAILLLLNG